jgi:hypothetical protein
MALMHDAVPFDKSFFGENLCHSFRKPAVSLCLLHSVLLVFALLLI